MSEGGGELEARREQAIGYETSGAPNHWTYYTEKERRTVHDSKTGKKEKD